VSAISWRREFNSHWRRDVSATSKRASGAKRHKARHARNVAAFQTAIPLSFIVGGPLASLILEMDGAAGLHGWQWIFLIDGIPAFLLAFVVLKFLPDGPARAAWLTGKAKEAVGAHLAIEEPSGRPDL
jgi:MFS family permease